MRYCQDCGGRVSPTARVCYSCGRVRPALTAANVTRDAGGAILNAGCGLILLAFGLVLLAAVLG